MKRIRRILGRAFRLEAVDGELDAEVRAYLEGLTAEKVAAGMSPDKAQRAALMELGGREQVKEAVRDVRFGVWLENLAKDFVYGARLLAKNPGFAAVAVLTLALGMGPTIAIFSFVNGILLRPLPYPEAETLVQLFQTSNKSTGLRENLPVSPPTFVDWRAQSKTVERICAYSTITHVLTGGEPERVSGAGVTAGFFDTLGVQPLLGQPFGPETEKPGAENQVILSYGVWQRRLGGRSNVIGETLQVSSKPYTIAGVMPRDFSFPEGTEIWLPLAFEPGEMKERLSFYLEVIGRQRPGVSLENTQAEFSAISAQIANECSGCKDLGARVAPLHEELVKGVRPTLALLFAAVGLVLLIACVNVANLLLARGVARERDLAVRAALGAGRRRLMQQLLSEGLLLALAGGTLGVLTAGWSLDALRAISPVSLPRLANVQVEAGVLAFSFLLAVTTTLLFGLVPAWSATRLNLSDSLKEGGRGSIGGGRLTLRSGLVVAEVGLSLVLLAGAGLMLRTLWGLLSIHPGFDARNVLTADVYLPRGKYGNDATRAEFARAALEQIRGVPGVESASLTSHLPLGGGRMAYGLAIEGHAQGELPAADLRFASPEYFKTMRIPVLRGRGLTEQDVAGATPVVVINQTMAAKYWPGQDSIGQRIQISRQGESWREVVGVVGDTRHASLRSAPVPEMYAPWSQATNSVFRLAIRTAGDPAHWASDVRQAVWAVDKDQPVTRLRPMEAVVLSSAAETRFFAVLFATFAGLALLLAAFGIYSVMAYTVTQRTREIGIRLALGARPGEVMNLVIGHGLRLAIVGIVLGVAGAAYASRWVEKLLYGVTRTDPFTFAAVAAVLLAAVLIACFMPARRATRVDPLVALRHE